MTVQPRANGQAQRILEEARAYKTQTILEAQGTDIAADPASYVAVAPKPDSNIDFRRTGVLSYMLGSAVAKKHGGIVEAEEIGLPVSASGLVLPCGASGRWESR